MLCSHSVKHPMHKGPDFQRLGTVLSSFQRLLHLLQCHLCRHHQLLKYVLFLLRPFADMKRWALTAAWPSRNKAVM